MSRLRTRTRARPADAQSRWRRLAVAALVGASVVVWPGFPGVRQAMAQQPPPYERALRWRDIIRLRLSPWLLHPPEEAADANHRN